MPSKRRLCGTCRIRVEEDVRPDKSIPYEDWFDSLDPQAAANVTSGTLRMEHGNTPYVRWFAGLGAYVLER